MTHKSYHLRNPTVWLQVLAFLLLFGGAGVVAFLLPSAIFAAILAAGGVVLAWLVLPEPVILGLLLVRSSVDGFMELFTLFAGSPLSMNLSGAVNSLAVGLGVLSLLRRLVRRQPLLGAGPGWTYAILLFFCLLSIPGSVDPAGGVKEWARLASGLAIYLMVAEVVHDERDARRVIFVMLASSLLPLALGWVQQLTGSGYFFVGFVGTEFAYRPRGSFAHPAMLGNYLIILLTLAAILYFSVSSSRVRALLLIWSAVAVGCLALTLARAQWLGIMIAALIVGLVKRRRLALGALVVAAVLLITVPLLRERLASSDSVLWRLDLWQAALHLAWPPTLLGRGLATSPWYINLLLPTVDTHPHNDYLKVAIELGLLGVLAFGAWLVSLIRHAWRAHRCAQNPDIAWRALGLLAVVMAGAAVSVVSNYLGNTAVQWYLWTLVALVPTDGQWPADAGV